MVSRHSQIRIQQYPAVSILFIKPLAHAGQEHHRKLQSLTLMNAHNADRTVLFTCHTGLAKVRIIFFQLLNIAHKMEQPLITGGFIGSCLFHQHIQVSPSGLSRRHGGYIVVISAFSVHTVQQLMDG